MRILRLLNIFNKPYPTSTNAVKQRWAVFLIALFVCLFLFIFKPFGLHQLSPYYRFLICLGYGGCTAVAMTLNFLGFNRAANHYQLEENWTVGKHILWNGWMLLTIAILNLIYSNIVGISNFTALNILSSLAQVVLVGLFPITCIILIDHTRLYRKNMRKVQELREQLKKQSQNSSERIVLQSSNSDDRLQLNPNELLYITSADNYINVVYRVHASTKQKLLRGTLTHVADTISHSHIVRCHRSYIVNLRKVIDISGNARGYNIVLRNTDTNIPVSQTYRDQFDQRLGQTGI